MPSRSWSKVGSLVALGIPPGAAAIAFLVLAGIRLPARFAPASSWLGFGKLVLLVAGALLASLGALGATAYAAITIDRWLSARKRSAVAHELQAAALGVAIWGGLVAALEAVWTAVFAGPADAISRCWTSLVAFNGGDALLTAAEVGLGVAIEVVVLVFFVRRYVLGDEEAKPPRIRDRAPGGASGGAALGVTLFVYGDITSQIVAAIEGFFASIWNGVQSFFGGILQSLSNLISSVFLAPVAGIQSSFQQLSTSANQFGLFAPLLELGIVSIAVVLVVFVLWLITKLSVSEGEQVAEEAEEGV